MILHLAETAVSPATLGIAAAVLGSMGGLYLKLMAVKNNLADEIITKIKAEQQPAIQHIGGQPIEVKEAEKFTLRASFDRHAEINRDDHKRIQEKAERDVTRLEQKLEDAKKEILNAGELRETRIHSRINELADGVGRLTGIVEQMNRKRP